MDASRGRTSAAGQTHQRIALLGQRRLAVLLEDEPRDRLGPLRCLPVAFTGLDDRSLHEQVPGEGEGLGVAQVGLFGERAHDRPDVFEVLGARLPDRMVAVGRSPEGR